MFEFIGFAISLFAVIPFLTILSDDLLLPAQGDHLRSRRGRVVRISLAIFWLVVLIAIFTATIWLTLSAGLKGLAGFFALAVPPFAAVYALRFLGPSLTRFIMHHSGA